MNETASPDNLRSMAKVPSWWRGKHGRQARRRQRLLEAINAGLREGKLALDAYRQAVLQLHPTPADRKWAIGKVNTALKNKETA